jgi:hypothetical protein
MGRQEVVQTAQKSPHPAKAMPAATCTHAPEAERSDRGNMKQSQIIMTFFSPPALHVNQGPCMRLSSQLGSDNVLLSLPSSPCAILGEFQFDPGELS